MSQLSQMCLVKHLEFNKHPNQKIIVTQPRLKIKIDSDFILTNLNKVFLKYEEDSFQSNDFSSNFKRDDILK
jgi:hypothetical protein